MNNNGVVCIGYRLSWRMRNGDKTGHGETQENRANVAAWVESANHDHPDILHWVETVYALTPQARPP